MRHLHAVLPLLLSTLIALHLAAEASYAQSPEQYYTCSMHPQVRLPNPGQCPICGMPLIAARFEDGGREQHGPTLELSEHARAMASIETAQVRRQITAYEVRAVGKVSYNETALATITTRVDGYAEQLFVNFTGIDVNKGDHLVEIYSPDLIVAQQELLVALKSGEKGSLLDSTVLKLRRWGLSEAQVNGLIEKRQLTERLTLLSPISGTVIARNVTQNAAFKAGDALYQIANLDTVWVYLDIYESQLPWLRYGQKVSLTTESMPGRTFEGLVTFVSPLVNEESRTVKVPVHIDNSEHLLKPGMFMSAVVHAALTENAEPAATGAEGKFTCPMHPQVIKQEGGSCPLCGMDLKQVPGAAQPQADGVLVIPASAVLDSGTRALVYVEIEKGIYQGREVVLGPKAGELYPVLSGLAEGEAVAVRGNFLLDSQAQISGASSLLYPRGAAGVAAHTQEEGGEAPQQTSPHLHHSH